MPDWQMLFLRFLCSVRATPLLAVVHNSLSVCDNQQVRIHQDWSAQASGAGGCEEQVFTSSHYLHLSEILCVISPGRTLQIHRTL
jgi:hypothetical protein